MYSLYKEKRREVKAFYSDMIVLIILAFLLYSLLGTIICDKLGILYDTNDFIELFVDGLLIAFWPITILAYLLAIEMY